MKAHVPILVLLLLLTFAAIDSRAATLTVTKIEDTNDGVCDADCSLREAVVLAVAGDTVVFSSLFSSPQTITLTLGQIAIDKNLTINGTGQTLTTISGNNASRIILITGGVTVSLSGMTFRDGNLQVQTGVALGGAIRVVAGTLNVSNATFTNNRASSPDGSLGGAIGGSFFNPNSTLVLSNVVVIGNSAEVAAIASYGSIDIRDSVVRQNTGGGLDSEIMNVERCVISDNSGRGAGAQHLTISDSTVSNNMNGGLSDGASQSTMTVERCIISGNSRNSPGGGVEVSGMAVIKDTQIINNTAFNYGGGISNIGTVYLINSNVSGNRNIASIFGDDGGGGIYTFNFSFFVINSTVSGNTAVGNPGAGGGIFTKEPAAGGVNLKNSTIANNTSAGRGGGVRINANGQGTFSNTMVAGNNSTGNSEEDVSGTFMSQGNNLIGNTSGSSGWIASDLLNVQPMLGPLADNGGGTLTHALLPGSPAINAGNNAVAIDPQTQMPLTSDQRGFLRFFGGTVDIGAYESQPEITGTIIYGNATGLPKPRYVSGVLLTAAGSPNIFATTSTNGTYTLGGFGSSSYTVTPSKTGDANGISSFDAGLIAKHVAGIQTLTGNQLFVADVSGNGTISSFDAGQTARYTAGLNGFGSTGNWVFIPVNRTYSSVNSSISGEDFIALLMGEVSGNWQPVSSRPSAVGNSTSVSPSFARLFAEKLCFSGGADNDLRLCRQLLGVETAAEPQEFSGQGRRSTASPQIERQSRDHLSFDSGSAVDAPELLVSNFLGTWMSGSRQSAADCSCRLAMEDMEKAKAKARAEEELRKCLPKEGEVPKWADDWLAKVWQGGKSGISAKHSRRPMLIDPIDPKVMWKWDMRGWLSKSLDGGVNWHRLESTYDNQWRYVSSLAVTRENDKTILLAGVMGESFSFNSGIMRSDDGGERWYRVCDGFAAMSVAFDPDDPQNAIAEIVAPPPAFGVSRVVFSIDGGKHWMIATKNGVALETASDTQMRVLARRDTRAMSR